MPVKQKPEVMVSGRSRGVEKARSSNPYDLSLLEVYSRYQKINLRDRNGCSYLL